VGQGSDDQGCGPGGALRAEEAPLEEVFVDKEVVHVKTVHDQPLWQTMLEKTCGSTRGHMRMTRAVSLELWRAKSENGRWRQLLLAAATTTLVELGMDD